MNNTQTDQEIMDEFYSTHSYPDGAGANWRDVAVSDDDDEDESFDLDTVIEEMWVRVTVAASTSVDSEQAAWGEGRRIQ